MNHSRDKNNLAKFCIISKSQTINMVCKVTTWLGLARISECQHILQDIRDNLARFHEFCVSRT